MKKTIKLALAASMLLGATSAFATNGSNLIGIGAKSRAMGGTGIGVSHGAESAIANAALITSVKDTEISFGGTIFMPSVSNTTTIAASPAVANTESADSAADMSVIPAVSIVSKVTDEFYWGIGMWGTAGMGVDYRDSVAPVGGTLSGTQMQMVTNLQLMQFGVPLAYTTRGFSVAITPVLQYGSLDIDYKADTDQDGTIDNHGMGVAQDLKMGYNIGLAYSISDITMGLNYKSQIDMEYTGFASVVAPFTGALGYTNDKLSTPAEIGLGVSYTMDGNTIALDYKMIQWSDAEGYKDFEWDDQTVIALGYEYATSSWAARVGYNYASSPISEQTVVNPATDAPNSANITPGVANTFNLLGFPGIVESHITLGGTYNFSKKTSVDLAYVYALEATETFKNHTGADIETTHSQTSFTVGLNYNF